MTEKWMQGKSVHQLERYWLRISRKLDHLVAKWPNATIRPRPVTAAIKALVDTQVRINRRQRVLRQRFERM